MCCPLPRQTIEIQVQPASPGAGAAAEDGEQPEFRKLILLGAGGTGKTVLFSQLLQLLGPPPSPHDLMRYETTRVHSVLIAFFRDMCRRLSAQQQSLPVQPTSPDQEEKTGLVMRRYIACAERLRGDEELCSECDVPLDHPSENAQSTYSSNTQRVVMAVLARQINPLASSAGEVLYEESDGVEMLPRVLRQIVASYVVMTLGETIYEFVRARARALRLLRFTISDFPSRSSFRV